MEPITFQTIFQFLQTASIMVGIAYYLMILQNQQKNYQLTLKNRQGQLVLAMMNGILSDTGITAYGIIRNASWSSYDDWKKKYGDNAEYMKAFNYVCQTNEIIYGIREERGYKYFENWEIAYHILTDYLKEHPQIDPFLK